MLVILPTAALLPNENSPRPEESVEDVRNTAPIVPPASSPAVDPPRTWPIKSQPALRGAARRRRRMATTANRYRPLSRATNGLMSLKLTEQSPFRSPAFQCGPTPSRYAFGESRT